LAEQKDNGPLLFNLMGHCFQDVGLTKWTSVIPKRCSKDPDCTKANFDECIRDYLKAVAGFPNVVNQLICWLCTANKPTLMPMHEFMWRQVQLLSYLKGGYLRQTMEVPTIQEKSDQIFFVQPKAHRFKFAELNKTVPTNLLKLIAFFEQCQATNKVAGILEKIASSQKKRKRLIFPPRIAVNQTTSRIVATSIATIIKATNAIATTAGLTIGIKMINTTIALVTTVRPQRAASPTKRRMITSAITSRKRAMRPCKMTSPLC
jgi:hypothetical protein